MRVAIVIFDGVDDLDAFGPFEVLGNASRAGLDLEVQLVALRTLDAVRTSHGATVRPGQLLGEFGPDLLIVPGGGWNDRAAHGAWGEAQRAELPGAIRRHHAAGATIAAVCTGAGIAAAAGILDGRPAATHHADRQDLADRWAQITNARVVDDGDVLSAGSVTSGLDLALWLIERYWGRDLADRVAAGIEYTRCGREHFGRGSSLHA